MDINDVYAEAARIAAIQKAEAGVTEESASDEKEIELVEKDQIEYDDQYVNHIDAFGLNTDNLRLIRLFFQPVLIFLALWTTGGWKYWKLWAKGKFKE